MAISSSFVIAASLLFAAVCADYRFNGFRGSIIPNNFNNDNENKNLNQNSLTNTLSNTVQPSNNNNNYNNNNDDSNNNVMESEDTANTKCVPKSFRDIRAFPGSCSKFLMCSGGVLITFNCPNSNVFNVDVRGCVPRGSKFDSCREEETNIPDVYTNGVRPQPPASQLTTLCPRGATYKKAHPGHCARYYDCGQPAMMDRWEDHEWECKYPYLFNEDNKRCEHYSMVSCGSRKIAYDRCEYKAHTCNGHAHCRPCSVTYPSCRGLTNGMNVWKGRVPSPYYVVCADNRVVYSGACPGGQLFEAKTGTCVIQQSNNSYW